MKINKILAAGVAATLAVTSLSAVASAAERTFDMSQSIGAWDSIGVSYKSIYGTKTATERAYATETNRAKIRFSIGGKAYLYKVNGTDEYYMQIVGRDGAVVQEKFTKNKGAAATDDVPSGMTGLTTLWSFDLGDAWWSAADVTVSGYKYDDKGNRVKVTQTAKADAKWDDTTYEGFGPHSFELVVLPDDVLTYKEGTAIAPAYFDEIEDVNVSATLHNNAIYSYSSLTDSVVQHTADETYFNMATLLLKEIKFPVSDAVVTYTLDGSDKADVKADVDTVKDGIETYIGDYATNRALVEGQVAKVVIKDNQEAVDVKITDEVLVASKDGVDIADKTPITARYKKVATNINLKNAATAATAATGDGGYTEVAAADAKGYATGNPVTVYLDGVKTTVYSVATESIDGASVKYSMYVDTKSDEPYLGDKKVKVWNIADAEVLGVYEETSEPDWSAYSKVVTDGAFTDANDKQVAKEKWYIRKNGTDTLEKVNGLFLVDAETATTKPVAGSIEGGNTAAAVIAYCIAHGGYDPAKELDYVEGVKGDVKTSNNTRYAYLQRTTSNSTIGRQDVHLLSLTNDWYSRNGGDLGASDYANQTYKTVDNYNKGTQAFQFAGLASQVADFFNKQNNGKIQFHFVAQAASASGWVNGGVPSTEVGLKSSLGKTNFGIFFNYNTSTGSLQADGEVDAEACTVTFDISKILDDMGTLTKGTLQDIYYGMNEGIRYSDYKESDGWDVGYLVDKITLSYEDATAAVDASTDDDSKEDEPAIVVADDDDDDTEVEDDDIFEDDDVIEDDDDDDDDVDADVIEDDDDDDTDVNNDVDYVDAGADDDANPGTGVGLAVIPAIVAAAAVVVSKKRK